MADVNIQKVENAGDRRLPVFQELDHLMERIQRRAFELFAGRGFAHGHDRDDWVTAEHEFCWPATELSEQDKNYVLSVALPGFEPGQVWVTATPSELIVHAQSKSEQRRDEAAAGKPKVLWSEFRSNDVYRRVALAEPIDVSKVTASLGNGLLKIVAAKAVSKVSSIPIASAA